LRFVSESQAFIVEKFTKRFSESVRELFGLTPFHSRSVAADIGVEEQVFPGPNF
jgi:hypothetical protein